MPMNVEGDVAQSLKCLLVNVLWYALKSGP